MTEGAAGAVLLADVAPVLTLFAQAVVGRAITLEPIAAAPEWGQPDRVVFDGDKKFTEPVVLSDPFWRALNDAVGDVGTVLFTGNVTCTGHASLSDRPMCLIVLGTFEAKQLSIFATEMLVGGLEVGTVVDRDSMLKVMNAKPAKPAHKKS